MRKAANSRREKIKNQLKTKMYKKEVIEIKAKIYEIENKYKIESINIAAGSME